MAPVDRVVRPEDELAEFGQPRTFGSQELKLETQRIQADNNAFELLRRAQAAQRGDMTPSQGIASALLAAIPTVGGYLIGKSVGAPKLPEGAYFKGMNPEAFGELYGGSGGAAGGLAGMKVGEQLQEKYRKSILEDPKLLAEQAQAEMYRSKDLLNDQNALVQADLTNQAAGERQTQAQSAEERQIRLRGEEDRRTAAAKGQDPKVPTTFERLTPEQQKAFLANYAGANADGSPIETPDKEGTLPAGLVGPLGKQKFFIDYANQIAGDLEGVPSWAAYQAQKLASGLDRQGLQAEMMNLMDILSRSRSGAALNEEEGRRFNKMIVGDFSGDPQLTARVLKKLAAAEKKMGAATIDVAIASKNPTALRQMFRDEPSTAPSGGIPTVGDTFQGSKVLSVTKVK